MATELVLETAAEEAGGHEEERPVSPTRWLADAYEQAQRLRLAMENRKRATAQGRGARPNLSDLAAELAERMGDIEQRLIDAMADLAEQHPAWPWLGNVKGIGPILAVKLLAHIDFERATTISKLWRFAGLAVVDGRAEHPVKGERNHYNRRLKTTMYLIGTSFLRSQSPYAELYYEARQRYYETKQVAPLAELMADALQEFRAKQKAGAFKDSDEEKAAWSGLLERARRRWQAKHPGLPESDAVPWTDLRCHLSALRRMEKVFLAHLWLYTRRRMGLPVGQPYVVEHVPGHHPHDEYEYVDRKAVGRAEARQERRLRRSEGASQTQDVAVAA